MSEYADKLQEWLNSVRMCEAADIKPCFRYKGRFHIQYSYFTPSENVSSYEFPIAVIESRPVFVGDELYNSLGEKIIVTRLCNGRTALESKFPTSNGYMCETLNSCSWNPPKNTVMVEFPFDIAHTYANAALTGDFKPLIDACRKALKEMK